MNNLTAKELDRYEFYCRSHFNRRHMKAIVSNFLKNIPHTESNPFDSIKIINSKDKPLEAIETNYVGKYPSESEMEQIVIIVSSLAKMYIGDLMDAAIGIYNERNCVLSPSHDETNVDNNQLQRSSENGGVNKPISTEGETATETGNDNGSGMSGEEALPPSYILEAIRQLANHNQYQQIHHSNDIPFINQSHSNSNKLLHARLEKFGGNGDPTSGSVYDLEYLPDVDIPTTSYSTANALNNVQSYPCITGHKRSRGNSFADEDSEPMLIDHDISGGSMSISEGGMLTSRIMSNDGLNARLRSDSIDNSVSTITNSNPSNTDDVVDIYINTPIGALKATLGIEDGNTWPNVTQETDNCVVKEEPTANT